VCVFFFVSVYKINSRNNDSIFYFGIFFDEKVNIVGALGGQNLKFPTVFKSTRKNNIKIKGKTGIFTQNQFFTKSILVFDVTQIIIIMHGIYMTFSLIVYICIFYTRKKYQNILICFELFRNISVSNLISLCFYECQ